MITQGMNTEEIIKLAAGRPELVWGWGTSARVHCEDVKSAAKELGLELLYGEPIRPGDMYLAARNTGPKLLTC